MTDKPLSFFGDDFMKGLPSDPFEALQAACIEYDRLEKVAKGVPPPNRRDVYLDVFGFLESLRDHFPNDKLGSMPQYSGNMGSDESRLRTTFQQLRKVAENTIQQRMAQPRVEQAKNRWDKHFGKAVVYELSDKDLRRAQRLVNDLRKIIQDTDELSDRFRRRLLLKLEKFQRELHKKVSSWDTFWGMFVEMGAGIGQFGKNIKPAMDRIEQLAKIIWRSQTVGLALPQSRPPALPSAEDGIGDE